MNSGRRFSLAAAIFAVPVMLMASDSIHYGKVNPPWRPGKYYSVKSRYEMRLDNIVLDVKQIRKAHKERHFWTLWLRETDHPKYKLIAGNMKNATNLFQGCIHAI